MVHFTYLMQSENLQKEHVRRREQAFCLVLFCFVFLSSFESRLFFFYEHILQGVHSTIETGLPGLRGEDISFCHTI